MKRTTLAMSLAAPTGRSRQCAVGPTALPPQDRNDRLAVTLAQSGIERGCAHRSRAHGFDNKVDVPRAERQKVAV